MDVNQLKAVYFIGAGGIGMSALVRYFLSKGKKVGGYDRTSTELTEKLIGEGALIHYKEDASLIPDEFKDAGSTLIVYTPAIPDTHAELVYFREHGFTIHKRSQVLGMLTHSGKGLCVAGTHGKTTTSTMTAHLLYQSHIGCNAFLGGISKNYGTNLLLSDQSDYVVIEADEFDRSFHWLAPYASVITATDADHLDIYGTEEAYLESFNHYTSLIQPGGLAQISGVKNEEIKAAMLSFKGVDRRFDFKIKTDKLIYLSDYAHHPEEIKQSILSMRALYEDKKLTAIFQPHLYTRTRDFYQDFADSLSLLDEVILTDIYPARELPIEGVSSQLIYNHLRPGIEKTLCKKEEILDILRSKEVEVLITLGAGDIENYVPEICEILNQR